MVETARQSGRVAVTGSSGLIGSRLCAVLASVGWRVQPLVRREPQPGSDEIRWDPARAEVDAGALAGVRAVVHLGGENVGRGRWSPARRIAIRDSRVVGTALLAECLANLEPPPAVFVAASAIGYYGDRGGEVLHEDSPPGRGFLPNMCRDWEAATQAAERAGIRVVRLRIGLVLSAHGGALRRMLRPFRWGLGGPVGSGHQYVSWIARDDLVRVIEHALCTDDLSGPVNAVAPEPVTNAEFARTLGRVMGRPALVRVPAALIRLAFGEMGRQLLLASARVVPLRLLATGFTFQYPNLEAALRAELGLPSQQHRISPRLHGGGS